MTTARSVTAVSSGTRPSAERRKRSSKQLNDVEVSDSVENAQQTEHQTASVTEGETKGNEDMAVLINDMTPSTNVSRQLLTEVDGDSSRIERGDAERDVVVEGQQQEPASIQTPVASSSTADTNVTRGYNHHQSPENESSMNDEMMNSPQWGNELVIAKLKNRRNVAPTINRTPGVMRMTITRKNGVYGMKVVTIETDMDEKTVVIMMHDVNGVMVPDDRHLGKMDTGMVVVDMTRAAITAAAPAKSHMIDVMDVVGMSNANNVDGVNTMDIEDTAIMGIGVNDSQRRRV
ncbi:hypothetical protein PPTG_24910 [Phytophthora nicotianae INRA-310]|uniref:Uncharacterized protein n=1 Tax=Phytophthora nicotianae (strain INRA-310) TaxID=761204 RepID=W2P946_PHYN3|nr:hypothetical protein PPTG_24910 [Phytophthora nicotianae INRA-310]ETM97552.1 hypothetical protein PPTG_24910 [Phytophthora nicotianae INRA-310]